MGILSRWRHRVAFYGTCPACGHDWREHPGGFFDLDTSTCGECIYGVEHEQRPPGSEFLCTERAAAPPPR